MKQFAETTMKARQALIFERYGDRQRSLRLMATSPDYWHKGAGGAMLRWGLDQAAAQRVAVTLFASPMGERLYAKFGFAELGRVRVQVEGEHEFVDIAAMAWEPEPMSEPGTGQTHKNCIPQTNGQYILV